MKYISTRDRNKTYSAAEAVVKGISDDGGLIVPSSFPIIDKKLLDELCAMDYPERAAKVLSLYMEEFSYDELCDYTRKAYSRFDGDPCPLVKVEDGLFVLELWHGPTYAFKDMALTVLPYLMTASKKKSATTAKPSFWWPPAATRARRRWKGSRTWKARKSSCSIPKKASVQCRSCR